MRQVNQTGIDRLERIRRGELPCPPMWSTVPVTLTRIESGAIEAETVADERHINAIGSVHGGFAATVLDTVLGLAVFTCIGPEDRHTTVDLAVKIVRGVPLGRPLTVRSKLVSMSRSVGVSEATLTDADGTVYAHGTTTCYIRRA